VLDIPRISRGTRVQKDQNRCDALPHDESAGVPEFLHHPGIVGWYEIRERRGADRCAEISSVEDIFHADRNAMQRTTELVVVRFLFELSCLGEQRFSVDCRPCLYSRFNSVDASQQRLYVFERGQAPALNGVDGLNERQGLKVHLQKPG
jgi:hypothetical protein